MYDEREPDRALLVPKVIWFLMFMSLGVYLFLGLYLADKFEPLMSENIVGTLRPLFYVLSLVTLIAIHYVRRLFSSAKGQYGDPNEAIGHPTPQTYMVVTIVSLAMSEAIAVFGLVLFLIGKDPMDLYVFVAISAISMFIYRPRRSQS